MALLKAANIGNGWPVIDVRRDGQTVTVYVRIPDELASWIDGGCKCDWCKAHPNVIPKWDCLAVSDTHGGHSWTVHYPDAHVSTEERNRGAEIRRKSK
jgi:hypothetical protein